MAENFAGVSLRLKGVKVDDDALLEPGGSVYIAAQRAGRAAVKHAQDELISMDAIDSGDLYNSLDYEVTRSGRGVAIVVGPFKGDDKTKRVAKYVQYGTEGPIEPRGDKPMPVQIKGGPLLFLWKVNGQRAKPYLSNALNKVNQGDWYDG